MNLIHEIQHNLGKRFPLTQVKIILKIKIELIKEMVNVR